MNWKILVFGIAILPLLVGMGIWQLQRAAEKEAALVLLNQQLEAPVFSWDKLALQPKQFLRLQLTGNYIGKSDWLVDNQIYNGQFGYRVYTPFCRGSDCILVDRGWIQGDLDRRVLPVIEEPTGTVTILGRLDKVTHNPVIGEDEPLELAPFRVQQINLDKVSRHLADLYLSRENNPSRSADLPEFQTLHPWILRMEPKQPGHFTVSWKPVVTGPEKHYGYAFQWFAMAIALIILVLSATLKKRK